MRLPPGLHHDPAAGLFVYDAAAHDAHQRGKAIPRQARTHSAQGHSILCCNYPYPAITTAGQKPPPTTCQLQRL